MTEIPEPIRQQCETKGGLKAIMESLPPDTEIERRSQIFQAMAEPMRLKILLALGEQPLCACLIKDMLGISDSKLSYHLGILKNANLIVGDKQGSWIIYSTTELCQSICGLIQDNMAL